MVRCGGGECKAVSAALSSQSDESCNMARAISVFVDRSSPNAWFGQHIVSERLASTQIVSCNDVRDIKIKDKGTGDNLNK